MAFSFSAQAHLDRRVADARRRGQRAAWHAENARALANMAAPRTDPARLRQRYHERSAVGPPTEGAGGPATAAASTTAAGVIRALDRTRTHFLVLAPDGTIAFANRAFDDWILAADDEVEGRGKTYADMLASRSAAPLVNEHSDDLFTSVRNVVTGALPSYVEEVAHASGDRLHVHLVSAQSLPEGGAVITHAEVTDYVRARQEFERRALRDSLTDLLNQGTFRESGARMVDAMVRRGRSASVMLIDIDRFKTVNDTFGHATGDAVLVAVAKRMKHSLRAGDLAGRVGGDEFGIVMCDVGDTSTYCTRLNGALAAPVSSQGTVVQIRASIGMARAPHDATTFDALMRLADARMYRSKREDGRGRSAGDSDADV